MKAFELAYLIYEPFLPVLPGKVRKDLSNILIRNNQDNIHILDVGARKSPYTIGLKANITLLDIPRQSEIQNKLNLGINEKMVAKISKQRSNIKNLVLEDMNQNTLLSGSFDGVVCIEVLEHITTPNIFLEEIFRVLKPGGWLYLTTPNGDYIRNEPPNYNPDHYHHYTKEELFELLSKAFEVDRIFYGIKTGKFRVGGFRSFGFRKPLKTVRAMGCNIINRLESRNLENQPRRTAHLFALVHKPNA